MSTNPTSNGQRRRIALVLSSPPLPFSDAAGRWYHVLLRGLVDRGHDVETFVPCATAMQAESVREAFDASQYAISCFPYWGRRGLRARWESFRRPSSYLYHDDLRAKLDRVMTDPSAILHLEHNWAGWIGTAYKDRAVLSMLSLYTVDLEGTSLAAVSTHWAERRLLRRYRFITTVTPELGERVQRLVPSATVRAVPLTFDTSLYQFAATQQTREYPVVGLIGSFHWAPSFLAARRLLDTLWPAIKQRVPDARLLLVGRDAKSILEADVGRPDVEILENVPDITPYFYAMDVMLYAPERGTGMKIKVIEAFALGTPVVTNESGAEGIPIVDGTHAGLANDNQGLVDRTVSLLGDPDRREQQRIAARQLIETQNRPGESLDRLEEMYALCA